MGLNFKQRIARAFPVWKDLLNRPATFIKQTGIAGAAAGLHTVPGIMKGDQLISVLYWKLVATEIVSDRTAEFIGQNGKKGNGVLIKEDGKIDDTGGTASDTGFLVVTWLAWEDRV